MSNSKHQFQTLFKTKTQTMDMKQTNLQLKGWRHQINYTEEWGHRTDLEWKMDNTHKNETQKPKNAHKHFNINIYMTAITSPLQVD